MRQELRQGAGRARLARAPAGQRSVSVEASSFSLAPFRSKAAGTRCWRLWAVPRTALMYSSAYLRRRFNPALEDACEAVRAHQEDQAGSQAARRRLEASRGRQTRHVLALIGEDPDPAPRRDRAADH